MCRATRTLEIKRARDPETLIGSREARSRKPIGRAKERERSRGTNSPLLQGEEKNSSSSFPAPEVASTTTTVAAKADADDVVVGSGGGPGECGEGNRRS